MMCRYYQSENSYEATRPPKQRLVSLAHPVLLLVFIPLRSEFPKSFTEYLIVHCIELVAEAHG